MNTELLEKIMELKRIERTAKEERVVLEQQLIDSVKPGLIKKTTTIREGDYKITITLNEKVRVKSGEVVPLGIDVYKPTVDEKKLMMYVGQPWVETYQNAPTIKVVKE